MVVHVSQPGTGVPDLARMVTEAGLIGSRWGSMLQCGCCFQLAIKARVWMCPSCRPLCSCVSSGVAPSYVRRRSRTSRALDSRRQRALFS